MLTCVVTILAGYLSLPPADQSAEIRNPKVAGITTVYRYNSHADVILSRLLQTHTLNGKGRTSPLRLMSMYTDQVADRDTSRQFSAEFAVPIFDSVGDALTLGTDKLAVEGVLLVAEHGKYPRSDTGQIIYPKRRLFGEVVETFRKTGSVVPVFHDKHLADNWTDAKWLYDTARALKIPMMAGSSLPVLWRFPPVDVRRGAVLKEIVATSYASLDAYGFHALEMLQALVERRAGGETGVKSVRCITGDAVWQEDARRLYDRRLLDQALSGFVKRPLPEGKRLEELVAEPVLFVIDYRDGLRANVFTLNGPVHEWAAAWRYADGEAESTVFWTQEGRPYHHFSHLVTGIEKMMQTGRPTWPVERTLLTSGILDAALMSKRDGGVRLATPWLDVRYQSEWSWQQPPPPPVGPKTPVELEKLSVAPFRFVEGKAFYIPPETTTEESGYFSLCEGRNGKIYVGTAAYARNAYLVEFDPATEKMRVVLDVHKLLGLPLTPTGYAAQSKLHTRNFVGSSGKIYVGTKQGYPTREEKEALGRGEKIPVYRGGYVITYDPATDTAESLGMPMPLDENQIAAGKKEGQGVIDVTADETRGLIYVITCEDQRWMLYDVKTKSYRELGPILRDQPNTVIDAQGRAAAITVDYQIARYNPATDKVSIDPLHVEGKPFADYLGKERVHPDWRMTPDGKTAYLQLLDDLRMFRVDLTGDVGHPVAATSLGKRIEGENPDSRGSISIGPDGRVYSVVRIDNKTGFGGSSLHHLVRHDPKTGAMEDLGVLTVENPGYAGKAEPSHGFQTLPDGTVTPLHHCLAMIVASDGSIYVTVLYPFTLLKIKSGAYRS